MRIIKGPLPPSVLVKSSKKSDDVNGQVKVKRKCGRPRNPIPRHKRESHINAEHRRRGKIQDGFRTLKGLVPKYEQTSGRDSKAEILFKTVAYCKVVQKQVNETQTVLDCLKAEKEALKADIKNYKTVVPEGLAESTTLEERYTDYLQSQGKDSWAFCVFSSIMQPLFESYALSMNSQSSANFLQEVSRWANQHLNRDNLSTLCTVAMRNLSFSDQPISPVQGLDHEPVSPVAPQNNLHAPTPPHLKAINDTPCLLSSGISCLDGAQKLVITNNGHPSSSLTAQLEAEKMMASGNSNQMTSVNSPSETLGQGLLRSDHQSAFHRLDGADTFGLSHSSADVPPRRSTPCLGLHETRPETFGPYLFPYTLEYQHHNQPTRSASIKPWQSHNSSHIQNTLHPHQPQPHDSFYHHATPFMHPQYTHLQDFNKVHGSLPDNQSANYHNTSSPNGSLVKQEISQSFEPLLSPSGSNQAKFRLNDFPFHLSRSRLTSRSSSESDGSGFNMMAFAKQTTDSLMDSGKYSQLSPSTDGGLSPSSGSFIGSPSAQASSPIGLDQNTLYRNLNNPHTTQLPGLSLSIASGCVHGSQPVALPSYSDAFGKSGIPRDNVKSFTTFENHGKSLMDFDFKAPRPVHAKDLAGSHLNTGSKIFKTESTSLLAELLSPQQKNSISIMKNHDSYATNSFRTKSGQDSVQNAPANFNDSEVVGIQSSHLESGHEPQRHVQDYKNHFDPTPKYRLETPVSGAVDGNHIDSSLNSNQNSFFKFAHQQLLKNHGLLSSFQPATSPVGNGTDATGLPIFPACGISRSSPLSYTPSFSNIAPTHVHQLRAQSPHRLSSSYAIPSPGSDDSRQQTRKCSFDESFPDHNSGDIESGREKRQRRSTVDSCPFSFSNSSPVMDSFRTINNMTLPASISFLGSDGITDLPS